MSRVIYTHDAFLVIVLVVPQNGVFSVEIEGQSPVSTYGYSPVLLNGLALWVFPGEFVQLPARRAHIFRTNGYIERGKLYEQPVGMFCLNARLGARLEVGLNAFVPEAFDHMYIV